MRQVDIDGWMKENEIINGFIQTAVSSQVQGKNWCVYIHTFPNRKHYVGITSRTPLERWNNGLGYKGQKKLYSAIKKYGWDNVSHVVNYVEDERTARHMEAVLIRFLDSVNNGYNIKLEVDPWLEESESQTVFMKLKDVFHMERQYLDDKVNKLEQANEDLKKKNERLLKELEFWQGKANLYSETNRSLYAMLVRAGVM